MLARGKLNSIETLIPQTLIDLEISVIKNINHSLMKKRITQYYKNTLE